MTSSASQLLSRTGIGPSFLAITASALFLASCADRVLWTHDTRPRSEWSGDLTACQRHADEQAARQLRTDEAAMANTGIDSALDQGFAVADAKRLRQRLYENCLSQRGYTRHKVD